MEKFDITLGELTEAICGSIMSVVGFEQPAKIVKVEQDDGITYFTFDDGSMIMGPSDLVISLTISVP